MLILHQPGHLMGYNLYTWKYDWCLGECDLGIQPPVCYPGWAEIWKLGICRVTTITKQVIKALARFWVLHVAAYILYYTETVISLLMSVFCCCFIIVTLLA